MTRNQIILESLKAYKLNMNYLLSNKDFSLLKALITEYEIELPVKNQKMGDFRWLLKDSR